MSGENDNEHSGSHDKCALCMGKIKDEIHNAVEDALAVRGLNEDDRKDILLDMVWMRNARVSSAQISQWTKKAVVGVLVISILGAMWFGFKAAILALLGK